MTSTTPATDRLLLHPDVDVAAVVRHPAQQELAAKLGCVNLPCELVGPAKLSPVAHVDRLQYNSREAVGLGCV